LLQGSADKDFDEAQIVGGVQLGCRLAVSRVGECGGVATFSARAR